MAQDTRGSKGGGGSKSTGGKTGGAGGLPSKKPGKKSGPGRDNVAPKNPTKK
jgi:hypothetical protein